MALFDAFSTRDNSSRNETTVIQDSYNSTRSDTTVYDNLGNVAVTYGGQPIEWAKVLPVVAIGAVLLMVAALVLLKGKR